MAASIGQVQADMQRLRNEMAQQKRQMQQEAARVEAENRAALEQLRAEAARQLEDDRRKTAQQYSELLQAHATEAQKLAEQKYQEMKAQYAQLEQELARAMEEERREMDALKAEHAAFTEEYRARQAQEQFLAERTITQAGAAIKEMEQLPMEWFRMGYLEHYRRQLGTASELQRAGLYQSAVGIAEGLLLKMELDRVDVEQELHKWMHYCRILSNALETEHELYFREGRNIEGMSFDFYAEEGIPDARLTEEMLAFWTEEGFPAQLKPHLAQYAVCDELLAVERKGGSQETMIRYMREHAADSAKFSEHQLYDQAKQVGVRLEETMQMLCRMRRRIRAYDVRQEIGADLPEMLEEMGLYQTEDGFGYEEGDKRRALVMSFEDILGQTLLDVHIIPIFSQADQQWYNTVGYFLQTEVPVPDLERRLYQRFQDFFAEDGVLIEPRHTTEELLPEQQTVMLRTDFQMRINGHL